MKLWDAVAMESMEYTYICYFPSGTENIPESIEERNMNRKYIPTLLNTQD